MDRMPFIANVIIGFLNWIINWRKRNSKKFHAAAELVCNQLNQKGLKNLEKELENKYGEKFRRVITPAKSYNADEHLTFFVEKEIYEFLLKENIWKVLYR